jgi:hypothetical protein
VYAQDNPLIYFDVSGLNAEECCYEYDWKCEKCIKRGPKRLNVDCFLGCIGRNSPALGSGAAFAGALFYYSHPVVGGVVVAIEAHAIYRFCYLPCKECPMMRLVNL